MNNIRKVVKFGGSSMRDAERIRQVGEIIKNDPTIRFVVVSAPGGMTNQLFQIAEGPKSPKFGEIVGEIARRFTNISNDLLGHQKGLDQHYYRTTIEREMRELHDLALEGPSHKAHTVSRGEAICGRIFADYLDFDYVDAAKFMRFNERGEYDAKASKAAWDALSLDPNKRYVIPGFYGADAAGTIYLLSRNASDVTAAEVTKFSGVSVFEKWGDTLGILRADPKIVPDAEKIDELTYDELRELTDMGSQVLHPDVVRSLHDAQVSIHVRGVDSPHEDGTWIVPDDKAKPKLPGTVTAVSIVLGAY